MRGHQVVLPVGRQLNREKPKPASHATAHQRERLAGWLRLTPYYDSVGSRSDA